MSVAVVGNSSAKISIKYRMENSVQYNIYPKDQIRYGDDFSNCVAMIVANQMYPEVCALVDRLVLDVCDCIMVLGMCGDEIENYADDRIIAIHLEKTQPSKILEITTISFQHDTPEDAANVFAIHNLFKSKNIARKVFIFDDGKPATEFIVHLKHIDDEE